MLLLEKAALAVVKGVHYLCACSAWCIVQIINCQVIVFLLEDKLVLFGHALQCNTALPCHALPCRKFADV